MKILIQTFSIFSCFALAAGCSQARPKEVQMLDHGLYQVTGEKPLANSNSPTGILRTGGTFELLKQTDTIPATVGTAFGFRFSIPQELQKTQFKYVYLFPEMKHPINGQTFSRIESLGVEAGHGASSGMFYNLTDPWELVIGEWTFQAFVNDRKLLEKKFTVVKPD